MNQRNFELTEIYDDTDVVAYRLGDEAVTVLGGRSVCVIRPWLFLESEHGTYPEAPEQMQKGIVSLINAPEEWSGELKLGELVMWSSRRTRRDQWSPPYSEDAPMFVIGRTTLDAQPVGNRVFNRRLIREALQAFIEDWEHGDAGETIRCSIKTLANGAALYMQRNRIRVYVMCLSDSVNPGDERLPTTSRCACQWEAGDSPCPVHGMDEEPEEKAAQKLDKRCPKFEVKPGIRLKSPYRDEWTVDGILEDTMVTLRNDEGTTIDRPVYILHSWWSVV